MPDISINYLAVLVCAVASVFIGFFWYSMALFGRPWMAAIGKTKEQVEADFSPLKIVGAFLGSFIIAYVMALIIGRCGIHGWMHGARLGALVGVGIVVVNNAVNYSFEGRPRSLLLINAGHDTLGIIVTGAILGAWQ